eukprot:COSAG01_NODE_1299_length_10836_cov_8.277452_6_plen_174_part_00
MAPGGQSEAAEQPSVQYCGGGLPVGETSHVGLPLRPPGGAGQVVPVHLGRQTQRGGFVESLPDISPGAHPDAGLPAAPRYNRWWKGGWNWGSSWCVHTFTRDKGAQSLKVHTEGSCGDWLTVGRGRELDGSYVVRVDRCGGGGGDTGSELDGAQHGELRVKGEAACTTVHRTD